MLYGRCCWGPSGSTRRAAAQILAHGRDTASWCTVLTSVWNRVSPFGCYLPLKNEQRSHQRSPARKRKPLGFRRRLLAGSGEWVVHPCAEAKGSSGEVMP